MQEIDPIYKNSIGMGFYWRKNGESIKDTIQVIFRDMGFYLKKGEILYFSKLVAQAKTSSQCPSGCKSHGCRSILLKTPSKQIDLAVSRRELNAVDDLLNGIIFHLDLQDYLNNLSLN
ncbi:MAG: hypothetical protein KTR22_01140 [Flavobacteriaceae bacterium]|nr:hypothetical protein [Flavobacteriaceae bacterium]